MNRRLFISKAAVAVSVLMLGTRFAEAAPQRKKKRLVILHTNDIHSRIDPFAANDARYPGQGGLRRIAALVDKIRKEQEHVILLDSGDVFQGTPYFNVFGGKAEFELMSSMGYSAGTIGNHDFDNGVEGLDRMLPYATFPILNCNYDFSNTILKNKIQPSLIKEINGIKVGLFGIGIRLEGLVDSDKYAGISWSEPFEKCHAVAKSLRQQGCDIVICLSHLGYDYPDDVSKPCDRKLARESRDIDIILGGHTHTFLNEPQVLANSEGRQVIVNQAGWAALQLGRIDILV